LNNDIPVGITPQEHRGRGTPINAALKTDLRLFCPTYFLTIFLGKRRCSRPANMNPRRR
jgi:hypothetical protein